MSKIPPIGPPRHGRPGAGNTWLAWWFGLLLWCCGAFAMANPPSANAHGNGLPTEQGVLEVYVRQGCPHCAAAKDHLPTLQRRHPGLRIVYRAVDEDPAARDALLRISEAAGHWPPGVPTFVYQGRVLVGFADAERSGPALEQLVTGTDRSAAPAPKEGDPWAPRLASMGLPLFTLAMGLIDGFNPCAMWVLLFLLALLVRLNDRRRMALIAGTFVAVSGLVYYAFMAAWLNVFLAVGLSGAVRVGLATVALLIGAVNLKDGVCGVGGFTLSIPETAKPGLFARMRQVLQAPSLPLALLGVTGLAVAVNFVELLCTAGLPAMYTAVLAQQELTPLAHYGYLGLYILGYLADDSLMVGTAVFALARSKLSEAAGRRLKLVSGVVMLTLGLVMLLRPQWL